MDEMCVNSFFVYILPGSRLCQKLNIVDIFVSLFTKLSIWTKTKGNDLII